MSVYFIICIVLCYFCIKNMFLKLKNFIQIVITIRFLLSVMEHHIRFLLHNVTLYYTMPYCVTFCHTVLHCAIYCVTLGMLHCTISVIDVYFLVCI